MDGRSAGLLEEDETPVSNPKNPLFIPLFCLNKTSKHSRNAKNIKTVGQSH
jgi:hypothetical protein